MESTEFFVLVAGRTHTAFAQQICDEMEASAKARGTGIAKRSPEYIMKKMLEGKAVVALTHEGEWAGFCYIEAWENKNFVANSGLIVAPAFRKSGLARMIKQKVFELSRKKYPNAKIFGLTTGLAVMKINSDLGYSPVTYSELTTDENFWNGCKSCVNYDILTSKNFKNCLCTGMLFDPNAKKNSITEESKPEVVGEKYADARIISLYPSHAGRNTIPNFKSRVSLFLNTFVSLFTFKKSKPIPSPYYEKQQSSSCL